MLATCVLGDPLGLRDRAMLEVLYSTGIRRSELANLAIFDLDVERSTLLVRQGKGRKDRMVPIGERAVAWVMAYLTNVRPSLATQQSGTSLFLTVDGTSFCPDRLSQIARGYVGASGVPKSGACHLFRHTCATLMLEGGADIRYIQAMLGHAELSTTQIYAQVSIRALQAVHEATHPGATNARHRSVCHPSLSAPDAGGDGCDVEQLFFSLELEEDQENRAGETGLLATGEAAPDMPGAIGEDPS